MKHYWNVKMQLLIVKLKTPMGEESIQVTSIHSTVFIRNSPHLLYLLGKRRYAFGSDGSSVCLQATLHKQL